MARARGPLSARSHGPLHRRPVVHQAGGAVPPPRRQVRGPGVPAAAKAVPLSLPGARVDGPGYVTAWPSGVAQPGPSGLNVSEAGETAANAVVVPLGAAGQISLFAFNGAHVVADVTG